MASEPVTIRGWQFIIGKLLGSTKDYEVIARPGLSQDEQAHLEKLAKKYADVSTNLRQQFADGMVAVLLERENVALFSRHTHYPGERDLLQGRWVVIEEADQFKDLGYCLAWLLVDNRIPAPEQVPSPNLPRYELTLTPQEIGLDGQARVIQEVLAAIPNGKISLFFDCLRVLVEEDIPLSFTTGDDESERRSMSLLRSLAPKICLALSLALPPDKRKLLSFMTSLVKDMKPKGRVRFVYSSSDPDPQAAVAYWSIGKITNHTPPPSPYVDQLEKVYARGDDIQALLECAQDPTSSKFDWAKTLPPRRGTEKSVPPFEPDVEPQGPITLEVVEAPFPFGLEPIIDFIDQEETPPSGVKVEPSKKISSIRLSDPGSEPPPPETLDQRDTFPQPPLALLEQEFRRKEMPKIEAWIEVKHQEIDLPSLEVYSEMYEQVTTRRVAEIDFDYAEWFNQCNQDYALFVAELLSAIRKQHALIGRNNDLKARLKINDLEEMITRWPDALLGRDESMVQNNLHCFEFLVGLTMNLDIHPRAQSIALNRLRKTLLNSNLPLRTKTELIEGIKTPVRFRWGLGGEQIFEEWDSPMSQEADKLRR